MYPELREDYEKGKKSLIILVLATVVLCTGGILGLIFEPSKYSVYGVASMVSGTIGFMALLMSFALFLLLYEQRKRVVLWERIADAPVGSRLEKGLHIYLDLCKRLKEKEEAAVAIRAVKTLMIVQLEEEAKKLNTP